MAEVIIGEATMADLDALTGLLVADRLPTDDLVGDDKFFLVAHSGTSVLGGVGLEVDKNVGLLRSLVVAPQSRSQGLGNLLLEAAENAAAAAGVKTLFLLTTTAGGYFCARGYQPASRDDAPVAIQATRQFAELCPASASLLAKKLANASPLFAQ